MLVTGPDPALCLALAFKLKLVHQVKQRHGIQPAATSSLLRVVAALAMAVVAVTARFKIMGCRVQRMGSPMLALVPTPLPVLLGGRWWRRRHVVVGSLTAAAGAFIPILPPLIIVIPTDRE